VAAETARVQKQVDVWQLAEQSRDDMATWLSCLLEQLREAVNLPPNSAQLREIIARYQVGDSYNLMCYQLIICLMLLVSSVCSTVCDSS